MTWFINSMSRCTKYFTLIIKSRGKVGTTRLGSKLASQADLSTIIEIPAIWGRCLRQYLKSDFLAIYGQH